MIDSESGGACTARQTALTLNRPVVSGIVAGDGTVTEGRGGLTATVLEPGLFLLSYPAFQPSDPGVVSGVPVGRYSELRPPTFELLDSEDPALGKVR